MPPATAAAELFPHVSRLKKPYLVLVEPRTGRAAAYDEQQRLLTEQASEHLVGFALQRHVHSERWDALLQDAAHPQPPSWAATPEQLGQCTLYWLRDSWSKFRDLLETPDH